MGERSKTMDVNEGYLPNFTEALEEGEIIEKNGHHEITEGHYPKDKAYGCTCKKPLSSGKYSYRDIKIRVDDKTVHFYHQDPLYTKHDNGDIVITQPRHHQKETVVERVKQHLPNQYILKRTQPRHGRYNWIVAPPGESPYLSDSEGKILSKDKIEKVKIKQKEATAKLL